jgi:hypothetical protein
MLLNAKHPTGEMAAYPDRERRCRDDRPDD